MKNDSELQCMVEAITRWMQSKFIKDPPVSGADGNITFEFTGADSHAEVSASVYQRLIFRHAILKRLVAAEFEHIIQNGSTGQAGGSGQGGPAAAKPASSAKAVTASQDAIAALDDAARKALDAAKAVVEAQVAGIKAADVSADDPAGVQVAADALAVAEARSAKAAQAADEARAAADAKSNAAIEALADARGAADGHRGGAAHAKPPLPPKELARRLAVTDFFVEKALAYLEEDANGYMRKGQLAFALTVIAVLVGAVIALWQAFGHDWLPGIKSDLPPATTPVPYLWFAFAGQFTHSFTAYGMIVLFAVWVNRYSKAMLDQAERLLARRHSLRQGRLFVHLNGGRLTVDELDKAFNWNNSVGNAFASMPTEASAPMGKAVADLSKAVPGIVKATVEGMSKFPRAGADEERQGGA